MSEDLQTKIYPVKLAIGEHVYRLKKGSNLIEQLKLPYDPKANRYGLITDNEYIYTKAKTMQGAVLNFNVMIDNINKLFKNKE